jgi:hypothetical protein
MGQVQIITDEQIEAGKSPRGGWTKKTLAAWGVSWPPPKGWRTALRTGQPMSKRGKRWRHMEAWRLAKRANEDMNTQWRMAMERDE